MTPTHSPSSMMRSKRNTESEWDKRNKGGRRGPTRGKVLDEELGIVAKGLAVEGVEHGVAGTIGGGGATVSLSSLAVLERLSTERTLVDLALGRAGEGETVMLELEDAVGCVCKIGQQLRPKRCRRAGGARASRHLSEGRSQPPAIRQHKVDCRTCSGSHPGKHAGESAARPGSTRPSKLT